MIPDDKTIKQSHCIRRNQETHPIMTLQNDILGPIPIAIFHRRLDISSMVTVEVGEYPILVLQTAMIVYRAMVLLNGREGAGGGGLGPEGAGGEIGEGGSGGSGRSRYHGDSWPNGCWEEGEGEEAGGEVRMGNRGLKLL